MNEFEKQKMLEKICRNFFNYCDEFDENLIYFDNLEDLFEVKKIDDFSEINIKQNHQVFEHDLENDILTSYTYEEFVNNLLKYNPEYLEHNGINIDIDLINSNKEVKELVIKYLSLIGE